MKAAALIVQCVDGGMHSVASDSLVGLRELAKTVRNSGKIDIEGNAVAVAGGVVLASWQMGPDMKFKCMKTADVAVPDEPVKAKGRPRK